MCKPKTPKAPDPSVVANAQAEANANTAKLQTELNRYNETNPFGSQTWSTDPNNPNKYTLNTTFDPRIQQNIDNSLALQNSNMAMQGKSNEVNSKMLDYTGKLADRTAGILANESAHAPTLQTAMNYANMADDRLFDPDKTVEQSFGVADKGNQLMANTISDFNNTQQKAFNYNGAPAMPVANEATRQNVSDAIYNRATSRLDPRFQQAQSDLDSKLAAQGITQGSAAYDREMENLARERTDAYSAAQNDADARSSDALRDIFGMGMDSRQQGVSELNKIRDLESQEALVANTLAGGATSNANQNLAGAVNRGLAIPAIANGMFDLDLKAFDAANAERNQALGELNSVREGNTRASSGVPTGPMIPQFSQGAGGGAAVGQTPIADSVYNSYQGQLNNYNAAVGSNNNMMSGIAGLGAAGIMAF